MVDYDSDIKEEQNEFMDSRIEENFDEA
jgi:hypothetical protein